MFLKIFMKKYPSKFKIHTSSCFDCNFKFVRIFDIHGCSHFSVTKPFLSLLHRYIVRKEQKCTTVSPIVKTDMPHTVTFQNLAEVLRYRVWIEYGSHNVNEDITVVFIVVTVFADTLILLLLFFQFQKFSLKWPWRGLR